MQAQRRNHAVFTLCTHTLQVEEEIAKRNGAPAAAPTFSAEEQVRPASPHSRCFAACAALARAAAFSSLPAASPSLSDPLLSVI